MSQEELMQIKQDMERLISDVKKLAQSESSSSSAECKEVACHPKCTMHGRSLMCLGATALIGGLVWAVVTRKHTS